MRLSQKSMDMGAPKCDGETTLGDRLVCALVEADEDEVDVVAALRIRHRVLVELDRCGRERKEVIAEPAGRVSHLTHPPARLLVSFSASAPSPTPSPALGQTFDRGGLARGRQYQLQWAITQETECGLMLQRHIKFIACASMHSWPALLPIVEHTLLREEGRCCPSELSSPSFSLPPSPNPGDADRLSDADDAALDATRDENAGLIGTYEDVRDGQAEGQINAPRARQLEAIYGGERGGWGREGIVWRKKA